MLVLFVVPGELSSVVKQEETEEVICTKSVSYVNITSASMHHEKIINMAQGEDIYEQI